MKRKLFSLLLMVVSISAISQESKSSSYTIPVSDKSNTIEKFKKYDMTKSNRPTSLNSIFENNSSEVSNNSTHSNSDLDMEAFAQIEVDGWGIISEFGTGGEIFYSIDRVGTTASVKTYDNDLEVAESFTIEVPESANQVEVLNHYSSDFFTDDTTKEFLIYVHYFDDQIPGPEGQMWEIWVVNSDGEILEELPATSGEAKIDADGNKKFYTYFDNDEVVTIDSYNVETWEIDDSYSFDTELIHFFMGSPFEFANVDGQEYIVIARYKHLFMDNGTMEVYPDNNLIIKLLDLDFNEVKSMSLDIETRYPDGGEYLVPMAEFGMFYKDKRYDVSKDIFNSDDKFEVVYGVYYFDMMNDAEWSNYLVANEDGEVLHELNEYIIDSFTDISSIEGQDNQLGFLMGVNGQATNLGFFDIESWEFVMNFTAEHNGDLLSNKFNRIAHEDTYHFLIGMGEPDIEGDAIYGVINEYTTTGEEFERHQFEMPSDVVLFDPVLTSYSLIPNLYTEEEGQHFMYTYKQQDPNGSSIFNNLVIAKDSDTILVEFRGDTEAGNITGSAFLTDGNGTYDKMTVQYELGDRWITDFYRLPFDTTLAVEDHIFSRFSFYPNPTSGLVNIQSDIAAVSVQVYSSVGKLLINKSLSGKQAGFDISSLPNGIYIAHVNLENGSTKKMKLIKK